MNELEEIVYTAKGLIYDIMHGKECAIPVISYDDLKTLVELGLLHYSRTRCVKGFISRNESERTVLAYRSIYGVGYKVLRPNHVFDGYVSIDYYFFGTI